MPVAAHVPVTVAVAVVVEAVAHPAAVPVVVMMAVVVMPPVVMMAMMVVMMAMVVVMAMVVMMAMMVVMMAMLRLSHTAGAGNSKCSSGRRDQSPATQHLEQVRHEIFTPGVADRSPHGCDSGVFPKRPLGGCS